MRGRAIAPAAARDRRSDLRPGSPNASDRSVFIGSSPAASSCPGRRSPGRSVRSYPSSRRSPHTAGPARAGAPPPPADEAVTLARPPTARRRASVRSVGAARSGGSRRRDRTARARSVVVDRLPRRDPQDPPIQALAARHARVRAQRRQERLLEAVVRVVRTDRHHQEPVHRRAVRLQEVLERRHRRSFTTTASAKRGRGVRGRAVGRAANDRAAR